MNNACTKCQIDGEDFVDFRGLLRKHWFFPLSYYLHSHSPIAIFKSELPVFLEKRSHESIIKKKLGTPFISIIIINIFKMSLVLIQTPLCLKKKLTNFLKKIKIVLPWPGIDPGSADWEPSVLWPWLLHILLLSLHIVIMPRAWIGEFI